jgi:uncharacterized protein
VTRVDGGTFFAEVTVFTPHGVRILDARPSDAIALASRAGAPIWVDDDVLDEAGVDDASVVVDDEDDDRPEEEKVDEFRRFLDDVEPEDFDS